MAAAAGEFDSRPSALASAEEGFKMEEEEDVFDEQLAPLEEMFHLLRCRSVAQVCVCLVGDLGHKFHGSKG